MISAPSSPRLDPATLEVLRQRLPLALQPEREFRSLRLNRRDLGLDTLEPRRGGLEALRQPVHAAVELRQPLREHAQAAVDLIELAFERGGALTQAVRRFTGLAVGIEHLTLETSDRAVANRAQRAQRSAHELVEFIDVGPEFGLQRKEFLFDTIDGPDAQLERRPLAGRLLHQALLQGGDVELHALGRALL